MKMKVLSKKLNFSNSHMYIHTPTKIWELTNSAYCDYKNFGKQRKRKQKKTNKIQGFSILLSSLKVEIGLNESQGIRLYLSLRKNTRFVLLSWHQKRISKNISESSCNMILKLNFALMKIVFWSAIFIFP